MLRGITIRLEKTGKRKLFIHKKKATAPRIQEMGSVEGRGLAPALGAAPYLPLN